MSQWSRDVRYVYGGGQREGSNTNSNLQPDRFSVAFLTTCTDFCLGMSESSNKSSANIKDLCLLCATALRFSKACPT